MSNEAVTWDELKEHCAEQRGHCHELLAQKGKNQALQTENERRHGYQELQAALSVLQAEVTSIKNLLASGSVWILPRAILLLLCAGMVGLGMAGRDVAGVVLKWFGGGQ